MNERPVGWFYRALEALPNVFTGGEKTAEELYDLVAAAPGIGPAPNSFVWGSVVRQALKKNLLTKTGERRAMKHKASHGRSTDVYRRVRNARRFR